MNLTQAEGLARVFPNINRLILPQGVVDFKKNIPPSDVSLIGLTTAVVVRKSLHPGIVYLLAQTLVEEHSAGEFFNGPVNFVRRPILNFQWPSALSISTKTVLHC